MGVKPKSRKLGGQESMENRGKVPSNGECSRLRKLPNNPKGGTFLVNTSTCTPPNSCTLDYAFDKPGLTAFGGAGLLIDFLRRNLHIRDLFDNISIQKAPWATYTIGAELEALLVGYALGIPRIEHMDIIEQDPLLCSQLGLEKLPQKSTFYRVLERFSSNSHVDELFTVNASLLAGIVDKAKPAILDLDTTVETVHGKQDGTTCGYNPRYRGRNSYQPLLAFDGNSKAVVNAELRNGYSPKASDSVSFYEKSKQALPDNVQLGYVRADRGFGSDEFLTALEDDQVGYTVKLRMNSSLKERLALGVLWQRIYFDGHRAIEIGSVSYQAKSWDSHRRIVLIRTTDYADNGQMRLFDLWNYQAIATNLDWEPEDIWRFYNQRCTSENYIKELKEGVHIDNISKNDFLANAADLWLKCMAYNCLLAMKYSLSIRESSYTLNRFRRMLIQIPAILTRHARRWILHLPRWWPYKGLWEAAHVALE